MQFSGEIVSSWHSYI